MSRTLRASRLFSVALSISDQPRCA
jgi:hypothetical protein